LAGWTCAQQLNIQPAMRSICNRLMVATIWRKPCNRNTLLMRSAVLSMHNFFIQQKQCFRRLTKQHPLI